MRCSVYVVSLCFFNKFEHGRYVRTLAEPDLDPGGGALLPQPDHAGFSSFCVFFLTRNENGAEGWPVPLPPSLRSATAFQAPHDSSEELPAHVCCSLSIFF